MSQLREPPATMQTQKPDFTKSRSSRDSRWASCPGLCWAGLSRKAVCSRRMAQEEGWRNVVQQLCQEGGHRYSLTGPQTENIRTPAFRSLTRKHTAFPGKLLFESRYYFSQWLFWLPGSSEPFWKLSYSIAANFVVVKMATCFLHMLLVFHLHFSPWCWSLEPLSNQ